MRLTDLLGTETAVGSKALSGETACKGLAMSRVSLALIGFGNVGQALASILGDHSDRLEREYGVRFEITAVADITGAVISTEPLPPLRLLEVMQASGGICHYPELGVPGMSGLDLVKRASADILVEASPTNVVDGEPGLTHIRTALNRGMHVVTANKGPLVVAFAELRELARERGLKLMYGPATAAAPRGQTGLGVLSPYERGKLPDICVRLIL